jgi:hypothetical protein
MMTLAAGKAMMPAGHMTMLAGHGLTAGVHDAGIMTMLAGQGR